MSYNELKISVFSSNIAKELGFDIVSRPETTAYPSVAFRTAAWFWKQNAYIIKDTTLAFKSTLNQLADGNFLIIFLITTYKLPIVIGSLHRSDTLYVHIFRDL